MPNLGSRSRDKNMKQNDQDKPDILAYLRGELSAENSAIIEDLMAQDAEFAADVEFQRTLRTALKENAAADTASEYGWARLSKAIDTESKTNLLLPAANDTQPSIRYWKYAAIFLACAVFGQAYLLVSSNSDDANDKYFMAGGVDVSHQLTIKPSAYLTVADLTKTLTQHRGLVTSGPDNNGRYAVSFSTLEDCRALFEASEDFFETTKACEKK